MKSIISKNTNNEKSKNHTAPHLTSLLRFSEGLNIPGKRRRSTFIPTQSIAEQSRKKIKRKTKINAAEIKNLTITKLLIIMGAGGRIELPAYGYDPYVLTTTPPRHIESAQSKQGREIMKSKTSGSITEATNQTPLDATPNLIHKVLH